MNQYKPHPIAKASLARRTQALDSPMFCRSRQVALPGGEKKNLKLIAPKTLATGVIVASYLPVTT
jgi:hypothetical protein